MKLAVVLLGLLIVSSACGEGAPARSAADEPKTTTGAPRTVALLFEAKRPGSKPFPFPFVEVQIGDVATRFLVDTGASAHAIDSATMKGPVDAMTINGWGPVAASGVATVELPPSIRAHGIGGILSPQRLAEPGQAVVVDLVNKQMRLLPRSTAWSHVESFSAHLTGPSQHFCAGQLIALEGAVDGEPTKLAIDTGASRTLVVESSKGGARAAARPVLGRSIAQSSMADLPASIHGAVPLTAGGWALAVDVGLVPGAAHPQCGYEARLGMDVLNACAIAMTGDEVLVGCRYPGR